MVFCSTAPVHITNGVDHCSSLMKTLNSVKGINFDPELETKEAMDREFHESQSVSDCKCTRVSGFKNIFRILIVIINTIIRRKNHENEKL